MNTKKYTAAIVLVAALILALLPQSAFGLVKDTSFNQKSASIPKPIKNFRVYYSNGETIQMGWNYAEGSEGVLIYRSNTKDGKYVRIAKVPYDPEIGCAYEDKAVKQGKTYYYKARPYVTVNGKLVKGKATKIRKKTVYHDSPAGDVTISSGKDAKELIFQVTMKPYSYEIEFPITEDEGSELGTIQFQQTWKTGDAVETRETNLKITEVSFDGKTFYIKANSGEEISLTEKEAQDVDIYCMYHGRYACLSVGICENA